MPHALLATCNHAADPVVSPLTGFVLDNVPDGLGKLLCGGVTPSGIVYSGVDISGPSKTTDASNGQFRFWAGGWGINKKSPSTLESDNLKKCAGIYYDDTWAVAIGGAWGGTANYGATGSGALWGYNEGDAAWTLLSDAYFRSAKTPTAPKTANDNYRECGRGVVCDETGNNIYVACQRKSDTKYVLLKVSRTTPGDATSTWTITEMSWPGTSDVQIHQMFMWPDEPGILYAACMPFGAGNGGVYKFNTVTGTSTLLTIAGTGDVPGGTNTDFTDCYGVNISGSKYLFVTRGWLDGGTAVFRYDVTNAVWKNITPTTYTGTNTAWHCVVGRELNGDAAVYIASWNQDKTSTGNFTFSPGCQPASAAGQNSPYYATLLRTLNGTAATPTWEVVSTATTVGSLGAGRIVYGTGPFDGPGERWVEADSGENFSEGSRLGGFNQQTIQLVMGHDKTYVLAVQKGGCVERITGAFGALSSIRTQPMVNGLPAVDSQGVAVSKTNPRRVILSDIDRTLFFSQDAGEGQMKAGPEYFAPPASNTTSPTSLGMAMSDADEALVCLDTGAVWQLSGSWWTGAWSITKHATNLTQCNAAYKWTSSGNTYYVAAGDGIATKKNSGAWTAATATGFTKLDGAGTAFVFGLNNAAVVVSPKTGIWRCTNLDAGTPTFTKIISWSAGTAPHYGRACVDPTGVILYYTKPDDANVYKWPDWANDAAGTAAVFGSGYGTKVKGAIDCDPLTGDLMVVTATKVTGDTNNLYYCDISAGTTFVNPLTGSDQTKFGHQCPIPQDMAFGSDGTNRYVYIAGDAMGVLRLKLPAVP